MENNVIKVTALETGISEKQINTVLNLLADGATVPFIARYRKEMTGNLEEEAIREIEKIHKYQESLAKRKEEVLRLIDEKGLLTDELKSEINAAIKLQTIEDLYLPFKEKKKTKATFGRANGLEPFSAYLLQTTDSKEQIDKEAEKYLNEEISDLESVFENTSYIIAEDISDVAKFREFSRNYLYKNGVLQTKLKRNGEEKDEKKKYDIYYNFNQVVNKIPAYRILAFNRAEKEKVVNVKIEIDKEEILAKIARDYVRANQDPFVKQLLKNAIADSFDRLIFPAVEREIRGQLKEKGDQSAIEMFASNLDKLIMQPPLKNKWVLGVDPAFRTGCKLAVIDATGKLEQIKVIYPTAPKHDTKGSTKTILEILKKYPKIEQIVIGNGTASRETEKFFKDLKKENNLTQAISIVSEAGASVYSASELAKKEFPDLHVEERSAISIARRIQDPMAELVKIDPKSIGVGQYQHDVNQKELTESLDFVMLKNINAIGVDLNTASQELLRYVSGLDKTIAKNIVDYRNENGKFEKRNQLLKVKRLGAKAYEQSAGFLKILEGSNYLDRTFIHPENYETVKKLFKMLNLDLKTINEELLQESFTNFNIEATAQDLEISESLLTDIVESLLSANIDIREELVTAQFDSAVSSIEELTEGMILEGQVRNIVEFGAFVDIGLKNDGLVHISQLSNKFIKNVTDVVEIGDIKKFKVKSIDLEKGKVQLTLKDL